MIAGAPQYFNPHFFPAPRPPLLLAIDHRACRVRRYQRKDKGAGGGYHVYEANIQPAETMDQLGDPQAVAMLENFRLTGRVA